MTPQGGEPRPRRFGPIIAIVLGSLFLVAVAGGVYFWLTSRRAAKIIVWTPAGTETAVKAVSDEFQRIYPRRGVTIVPVPLAVYEMQALYALASQIGTRQRPAPDVWIMPNDWLEEHRDKLVPAPPGSIAQAQASYKPKRGQASPLPPAPKGRTNDRIISQDYPPIASRDLIVDNRVYGVPLDMDSLALFYDKTRLNNPPKTWSELVVASQSLTVRASTGVTHAGVALGDSQTVAHAIDLLSILMLQNGVDMVDHSAKIARFNLGDNSPGARTLDFYTSFARPDKQSFSWAGNLGSSLDALKNGAASMAFGYLSDAVRLGLTNNPRLSVAPLPQVNPSLPQTYGRYLAATVTKQASDPLTTWQFVGFLANPEIDRLYGVTQNSVPGRTDAAKSMDFLPALAAFRDQAVNAVNWPKAEVAVADKSLREAIDFVTLAKTDPQVALDASAKSYSTFLQRDTGLDSDPRTLVFWQPSDDTNDYRSVLNQAVESADFNTPLRVILKSRRPAERYEWELLNAMAARGGPDMAMIRNDEVPRYALTLRPYPLNAFNFSEGGVKSETFLRRSYAPAIVGDNMIGGKLYGMPIAFQTMLLAFNPDELAAAQTRYDEAHPTTDDDNPTADDNRRIIGDLFESGPVTWDDLKRLAELATSRQGDNLTTPFVALGTGENVAHAADIYVAVLKQYGGDFADPDKLVTGIHLPATSRNPIVAGQKALELITGFARPSNAYYTWNKNQPSSLDALAQGQVIAAFIYPGDIPYLKEKSTGVRLQAWPFPQLATRDPFVDMAAYFSAVIPKASRLPEESTLIMRGLLNPDNTETEGEFLLPFKLRSSVITDRTEARDNPQAIQVNTAASYFKGVYPREVDQILRRLLDGQLTLNQAAAAVNQSLARKILP